MKSQIAVEHEWLEYVRIWSLQVRIIDLLTPLMLCVLILYISGGTYSLKSTPNDRFFEKLFTAGFYLLSEFLPEIC